MSNIGSIGSSGYAMRPQRPDPAKMTDALFAKLDTTGKGYLEKSDLQSTVNPSDTKASVDTAFAKLDNNSDGKLTKSEVSDGIKKLADALGNQLNETRMGQGQPAGKGGPPPPPDKSASSSAANSSTNSNTSIDPADSNGDGTVSTQEALAYADKQSATAETSSSDNSASLSSTGQTGKSMKLVMEMMSAYNNSDTKNSNLSVSA